MSIFTDESFEISVFRLFSSTDILSAVLDRFASLLSNLASMVFNSDETFFRSLVEDVIFFSKLAIVESNFLLSSFIADLIYLIAVVASLLSACKEEILFSILLYLIEISSY
ncbi:MAG: hypothetical protein KKC23_03535, partial [Proteobacteria bacterium]|nr:hypothetical protein [Pseudomonadota bacterium]